MPEEQFTIDDLEKAVDDLATIPYFPVEARSAVMTFLREAVPHRRALRWLACEAKNHVTKWPGLAELRGLLCTRFDAADGIDQWCSLPGYTAADAEAKHYDQHAQLKEAQGYIAEESRELLKIAHRKNQAIGAPHGN